MKHQKEIDRPSRMPDIPWQQKERFIELVTVIIGAFRRQQIDHYEAFDDIRDAFFECLEKKG